MDRSKMMELQQHRNNEEDLLRVLGIAAEVDREANRPFSLADAAERASQRLAVIDKEITEVATQK